MKIENEHKVSQSNLSFRIGVYISKCLIQDISEYLDEPRNKNSMVDR